MLLDSIILSYNKLPLSMQDDICWSLDENYNCIQLLNLQLMHRVFIFYCLSFSFCKCCGYLLCVLTTTSEPQRVSAQSQINSVLFIICLFNTNNFPCVVHTHTSSSCIMDRLIQLTNPTEYKNINKYYNNGEEKTHLFHFKCDVNFLILGVVVSWGHTVKCCFHYKNNENENKNNHATHGYFHYRFICR